MKIELSKEDIMLLMELLEKEMAWTHGERCKQCRYLRDEFREQLGDDYP